MVNNNPANLDWRNVYSSHVTRVAHDEKTGELHVQWDTGKHSIYSDVDEKLARRVMYASSVGGALINEVKNRKAHRYAP